jgi:hypothetical protein
MNPLKLIKMTERCPSSAVTETYQLARENAFSVRDFAGPKGVIWR